MELSENKKLNMMFTEGAKQLKHFLANDEVELIEDTIPEDKPEYNIIRFQDEAGFTYSITQIATPKNDSYVVKWVLQNVKKHGVKINLVNMRRHNWIDKLTNPLISEKNRYHWFKTNDKLLINDCELQVIFNEDNMQIIRYYTDGFRNLYQDVKRCTFCASFKKTMQADLAVVNVRKNEQLTKSLESIAAIEEPIAQLKELFDEKYYSFSAPTCFSIVVYDELHYAKVNVEYTVFVNTPIEKQKFVSIIVVATIDTNTFEVKYNVEDFVKMRHVNREFCVKNISNTTDCLSLVMNVHQQLNFIYSSSSYIWCDINAHLKDLNNEDCKIKQAINCCTTEFKKMFEVLSKLGIN